MLSSCVALLFKRKTLKNRSITSQISVPEYINFPKDEKELSKEHHFKYYKKKVGGKEARREIF